MYIVFNTGHLKEINLLDLCFCVGKCTPHETQYIERIQFLFSFLVFVVNEIVRNNRKVFALFCDALLCLFGPT